MEETSRNFEHKELYQIEIGKQILRAKKIRWFKQQQIQIEEITVTLD